MSFDLCFCYAALPGRFQNTGVAKEGGATRETRVSSGAAEAARAAATPEANQSN